MRRSSPTGSITAPDRICAPTSEPFSRTTTDSSLSFSTASCLSLIAAARPAGPAPTMTTSNSMVSRSVWSFKLQAPFGVRLGRRATLNCPSLAGKDTHRGLAEASQMSGSQTAEAALLAWYEAMGVDEAIGEMPLDCFAVPTPELPLARPVTQARPLQVRPSSARPAEALSLAELETL